MVTGMLIGLLCVLVGLTLGLWTSWLYWRDRVERLTWQLAGLGVEE